MTQHSNNTGLVFHEAYLTHDTGPYHPERPERLAAVMERLNTLGSRLTRITPVEADEEWITRIHSKTHADHVRDVCAAAPACLDSGDTPVCPESFRAALLAVGGLTAGVDAVVSGETGNTFCAVRPPGHHAARNTAMGFCLFNNVAIGARYAQAEHSLKKVLIVDWDVHHGNGTQDAFYDDGTVLYFSIHRYPFYPGTGSENETGTGEGKGAALTINCPISAGAGDEEYMRLLEEKLLPAAEDFRPDIVFISAGFDAYENDPLGGMAVTVEGFARMTGIVQEIASKHCGGRIVSALEGGYDIKGLADCVEGHVGVLLNSAT